MIEAVLDASAILAYLKKERGHELVEQALSSHACLLSTVNYVEVLGKLSDDGLTQQEAQQAVALLGVQIEPFNVIVAEVAGCLRATTRTIGASLGDRCCLALAESRAAAQVYTTDAQWARLKTKSKIHVLR